MSSSCVNRSLQYRCKQNYQTNYWFSFLKHFNLSMFLHDCQIFPLTGIFFSIFKEIFDKTYVWMLIYLHTSLTLTDLLLVNINVKKYRNNNTLNNLVLGLNSVFIKHPLPSSAHKTMHKSNTFIINSLLYIKPTNLLASHSGFNADLISGSTKWYTHQNCKLNMDKIS